MHKGQKGSAEFRERMRHVAMQRSADPAYCRKLSRATKRRALDPTPAMLAGREQMRAAIRARYAAGWAPRRGKPISAATRHRLRAAMRRRVAAPDYVPPASRPGVGAKISAAKRLRPTVLSPETRARIGRKIAAHFRSGRMTPPMHYPGAREKMSQRWRGVPKSVEHRRRVSEGMKRAHAKGRAGIWPGAITPGERAVWPHLRRLGFRRQVLFQKDDCSKSYRVDFANQCMRIVLEIDGSSHQSHEARQADAERDAFLRSIGYHVLRFFERHASQRPRDIAVKVATYSTASRRKI